MVTPSSGSPPDQSLRPVRVGDSSQRTSLTMQGGVFKAPMPPHQEATGRRDLGFPNSPVSGLGSPHRSPYASGTPQLGDAPSSRPSPDPFRDPQTPGTPHPHSDCGYLAMPTGLRADPVSQPSPSSLDSYPSNPGTPRSSERFPRSPGSQRSVDLFPQSVGTPRPPPELHLQQPSAPRAQKTLAESLTAPPPASASSPLGPGLMAEMGAPKVTTSLVSLCRYISVSGEPNLNQCSGLSGCDILIHHLQTSGSKNMKFIKMFRFYLWEAAEM